MYQGFLRRYRNCTSHSELLLSGSEILVDDRAQVLPVLFISFQLRKPMREVHLALPRCAKIPLIYRDLRWVRAPPCTARFSAMPQEESPNRLAAWPQFFNTGYLLPLLAVELWFHFHLSDKMEAIRPMQYRATQFGRRVLDCQKRIQHWGSGTRHPALTCGSDACRF